MKEVVSKKPVSNTCYTIASKDGRVLEVADFDHASGAAVQLWENTGVDSQKWLAVEVVDGLYKLENKLTGKVLDGKWVLGPPVGLHWKGQSALAVCGGPWRIQNCIQSLRQGAGHCGHEQGERRPCTDLG